MTGLFSQPQDVYECKLSQCWCQDYKNISCVNVSYRETNVCPTTCTYDARSYPMCNHCSHQNSFDCNRSCCHNSTTGTFKFKKFDYKDIQKEFEFADDDDDLTDSCLCPSCFDCSNNETGQNYPSNFNLDAVSTNDGLSENYHEESRTFSFKRFHTENTSSRNIYKDKEPSKFDGVCRRCSCSTSVDNKTIFLPSCGDYIYNNPKCKPSTLYGFDCETKSSKSSNKCCDAEEDTKVTIIENKPTSKSSVETKAPKPKKLVEKIQKKTCVCDENTKRKVRNVSKSSKQLKRSWGDIKDVSSAKTQKDIPNKRRRSKSRKRGIISDKKEQDYLVFPCIMPNIKIVSEEPKTANKDCLCEEKNFKKYLKTIAFKDVTKYYLCHSPKNVTDSNLICKCSQGDLVKSTQYTQYEGDQQPEVTSVFLEQSGSCGPVLGNEIELVNVYPSENSKFSSVLAENRYSLQSTLPVGLEFSSRKSVKASILSNRSAQTMKSSPPSLSEESFEPVATSSRHSGLNTSLQTRPYLDADVQTSIIGSYRSAASKGRSTGSKTPSQYYSRKSSVMKSEKSYSSKKPSLISGDFDPSVISRATDPSSEKSNQSTNSEIQNQNMSSFRSQNSTRNSFSGSIRSTRPDVSENSTGDRSIVRSTNTNPERTSISSNPYSGRLSISTNPYPERLSIMSQQYANESTITSNRTSLPGRPSLVSQISEVSTRSNRSNSIKRPSVISRQSTEITTGTRSCRSGSTAMPSISSRKPSLKNGDSRRLSMASEATRSNRTGRSQRLSLMPGQSNKSYRSRRASSISKNIPPNLVEDEQEYITYSPGDDTSSVDSTYQDDMPGAPPNSLNLEPDDNISRTSRVSTSKRYSVSIRDEKSCPCPTADCPEQNDSNLYCYKPVILCKCETSRNTPRCSNTYFSRIEVIIITIFMVLAWWFTLRHI